MFAFLWKQNFFLFELMLTIRMATNMLPGISNGMLLQDKICSVVHNQTDHFCRNIQVAMEKADDRAMKDLILAESATFNNYKKLIETIPTILWSLCLGPFLDKYASASYVIFVMSPISDIISSAMNLASIYFYNTSPYYLLVPSVLVWLTGGMNSFTICIMLYLTKNSSDSARTFKFVAMEVVIFVGFAGATFLGGQLLSNTETGPQLRTYHYNYYACILLDLLCIAILIVIFLLDLSKRKNATKNEKIFNEIVSTSESSKLKSKDNNNILASVFSIENARQTLHCFFKRRPNNLRMHIMLLCVVQFVQMLIAMGMGTVMVQFDQKVYHWGPQIYSTYSTVGQVIGMVMLAIFSAIFVKILKLTDSSMICIALVSSFAADLIRGSFMSELAYFISIPVGSLSTMGIVSAKTKFSKIVPEEDTGKIFCLQSIFETIVSLGASVIYTNLFALSIGHYPGLVFHFSCVLIVFLLGMLILEHIYCPVMSNVETQDATLKKHKQNESFSS